MSRPSVMVGSYVESALVHRYGSGVVGDGRTYDLGPAHLERSYTDRTLGTEPASSINEEGADPTRPGSRRVPPVGVLSPVGVLVSGPLPHAANLA